MRESAVCFALACLLLAGCGSSSSNVKSDGDTSGSATPHPRTPAPPSAIRQNASMIVARIDSIARGEGLAVRVAITVDSSGQAGGVDSFAEPGQRITITPEFTTGADGAIDTTVARNVRIKTVTGMKTGDRFRGIISLRSSGEWVLTDLLQPLQ